MHVSGGRSLGLSGGYWQWLKQIQPVLLVIAAMGLPVLEEKAGSTERKGRAVNLY